MANWGAQQFVRFFKESAYGTDNTGMSTPVEETDFSWQRLHQSNAFTMRPNPQFVPIRAADTGNRNYTHVATRFAFTGSFTTLFYPAKAAFLLNAAMGLAGTPNNLPSYDFDHFDGVRTRRYTGGMIKRLVIRGDAQSQIYTLAFDLVAQKNIASDPTVSAPASTSFVAAGSNPYTHVDTAGVIKINNVVEVNYSSLEITIDNTIGQTWDEQAYVTSSFYAGRDVTFTVRSQYTAVTHRNLYEAVTKLITNQVKWVKGASSVTFDLKSSNFITTCNEDLPLDNASYQTLTVASDYDQAAATDAAFTVVP